MGPRRHLDVEPTRGVVEPSMPQGRDQAGPHGGRLPTARGPHHREETRRVTAFRQPGDEPLDERLAAEEVLVVGFDERAKSLEWIRRFRGGPGSSGLRSDGSTERLCELV